MLLPTYCHTFESDFVLETCQMWSNQATNMKLIKISKTRPHVQNRLIRETRLNIDRNQSLNNRQQLQILLPGKFHKKEVYHSRKKAGK
jgi:hypothetical protein